jgi:hypothetical protein
VNAHKKCYVLFKFVLLKKQIVYSTVMNDIYVICYMLYVIDVTNDGNWIKSLLNRAKTQQNY